MRSEKVADNNQRLYPVPGLEVQLFRLAFIFFLKVLLSNNIPVLKENKEVQL